MKRARGMASIVAQFLAHRGSGALCRAHAHAPTSHALSCAALPTLQRTSVLGARLLCTAQRHVRSSQPFRCLSAASTSEAVNAAAEEDAAFEPEGTASEEVAAVAESALPDEGAEEDGAAGGLGASSLANNFEQLWDEYVAALEARGFFSDEDDTGMQTPIKDKTQLGALKRAALRLGRTRLDIIYSLPEDKVAALADAPVPYPDRKTSNSMRRLKATFINQVDAHEGVGGGANSVDLMRLLVAARIGVWQQEKFNQDLYSEDETPAAPPAPGQSGIHDDYLAAACALIPEVLALMDAEPDADALLRAETAQAARDAEGQPMSGGGEHAAHDDWREPRGGGGGGRQRAPRRDDSTSNMKPGDWSCPDCASHNFARRMECFRCGAPRPEGTMGAVPAYNRGRPYEQRQGDWQCGCGADNFSFRTACFRCDAPRPASAGPAQARGGQRPPRQGAPQKQPGDWMCNSCGQHNFRSRAECYKCAAPKSEGTVVTGGDDGDMGAPAEQWYGNDRGGGGGGGRGGGRGEDFNW